LRTKEDDSQNIGAFVLNLARAIEAIALTQNFPARLAFDSRSDSFFANEAGHSQEQSRRLPATASHVPYGFRLLLPRVGVGIDHVAGLVFRRPQDRLLRPGSELVEVIGARRSGIA
jgi:hypothetical protein